MKQVILRRTSSKRTKLAQGVALAAFLSGGVADAWAGYQGHSPGPLLNTGKTSNNVSLMSMANNPGSGELLIDEDESFRMGYFASVGGGIEFGDLNNVEDDIEELEDLLDDENLSLQDAIDAQEKFEELLPVLGDDFNVAVDFGLHVPLFPMAWRNETLGGVLGFDLRSALLADVRFLDAPINIVSSGTDVTLQTDSALYLKAANLTTARLGYSREVWQPPVVADSKLYAGVNLNYYNAEMNKQVISFQAAAEDDDEEIGDIIRDEFEENIGSSSGIGLDLGVLWTLPNAYVGLTISNINEPEFEYGEIGSNCNQFSGLREKNCLAAQAFSDEIALQETAVLTAQTTIEGGVSIKDGLFSLSGSYDVNTAYSLVGRESQILSGSAGVYPESAWIPGLRFGFNKNLAGTKLTKVGFGATFLGVINLDAAISLDKVQIDGEERPRYVGFNIGFEEKF